MLPIHLERRHWIFLGLGLGLILVLAAVLSYIVMWSPRKIERDQANIGITGIRAFLIWLQATFPWILILTLLGTTALSMIYPLAPDGVRSLLLTFPKKRSCRNVKSKDLTPSYKLIPDGNRFCNECRLSESSTCPRSREIWSAAARRAGASSLISSSF